MEATGHSSAASNQLHSSFMPRYEHIAVASALSPRFRAVLAEGWRFANRFDARFSIIHAAGYSPEREEQFREANEALGIPLSTPIIWKEGPAPASSIVDAAQEHGVDLLVAGALERDAQMHFLGGVARELMRRLHCSLLLFTHPEVEPHQFRRLVAITDYTEEAREAFRCALKLAEMDEAEILHVLSVFSPFAKARASLGENGGSGRHEDQEEAMLEEFVSTGAESPVTIDPRVIHTTTGMGASDFTKNVDADLLIVPASAHPEEGTLLPAYLDWVFKVIPCNLWVVKPTRYL
jgi:nucleotide-binding universal stress UspA family protein